MPEVGGCKGLELQALSLQQRPAYLDRLDEVQARTRAEPCSGHPDPPAVPGIPANPSRLSPCQPRNRVVLIRRFLARGVAQSG